MKSAGAQSSLWRTRDKAKLCTPARLWFLTRREHPAVTAAKNPAQAGIIASRRPLATPIALGLVAVSAIAVTAALLAAVTVGASLAAASVPATPRGASGPYSQVQYGIQLPTLPLSDGSH